MALKERISVHGYGQRTSRTRMVICIALICVLAVGLGTLSVYTVLTLGDQRRLVAEQAAALSDTQSRLEQAQSDLAQKQAELEEKQKEWEQSRAAASSDIAAKDDTIKEQEKTIKELKKTIKDLKKQVAQKPSKEESQTSTTKPVSKPAESEVSAYKEQKIVALTFDDGPGPYTAALLDILKERKVPATFFVLGTRVSAYPELIKRMKAEGHEIGNHSNSHKDLRAMSTVAQIKTEMDLCADKVKTLVGHRPTVMRCPYGNWDDQVVQYAKGEQVPIIQWDIDTRDWESRNVNAILNTTLNSKGLGDGSIILLHDIHKTSVDAIPKLLDRLTAQGYTFVTVTELLQARCGLEAGKIYYEG